jgi:transcriptional regulator of acetoin/glycerol metabolism
MRPSADPAISAETMIASGAKLEEMEQSVILKSLEAHGGNVSATARALGVSRNTIYRKVPSLK